MSDKTDEIKNITLIVAASLVVGLLLTIMGGNLIREKITAKKSENARLTELSEKIATLEEHEKVLSEEIDKLESEYNRTVEAVDAKRAENELKIAELSEKNDNLRQNSALSDVFGEGLIILVDDAGGENGLLKPTDIVHDSTILTIVEGLSEAGAEAISVNGERIMTTTAIKCAGSNILINGHKVYPPFAVKAVGKELEVGFKKTVAFKRLSFSDVTFDMEKSSKITVPKGFLG